MLTALSLQKLSAPFPPESISVKINSTSKDKTWAMLVLYLQHTDVYGRLESVDPSWSCEAVEIIKSGDLSYCRMRMTVDGVTRENVGDGNDPKGAYSDALKRCAMLFGVGRYLYDADLVWVPYNESTDKFKHWTYADYKKALEAKKLKEAR